MYLSIIYTFTYEFIAGDNTTHQLISKNEVNKI